MMRHGLSTRLFQAEQGDLIFAGPASGGHCCTWLTTAARSKRSTRADDVVVLLTNSMT